MNTSKHWDKVYQTKTEQECSWYEPYPRTSVELTDSFQLSLDANIIDVGGGDGRFAEAMLEKGYRNIYVLDISSAAMERARQRMGEKAGKIHWIVKDILDFEPPVLYDYWHDRATFHFLTDLSQVSRYASIAARSIKPGGKMLISTFATGGPVSCSGLNTQQYSEQGLMAAFANYFDPLQCRRETHYTPQGKAQEFIYAGFCRK